MRTISPPKPAPPKPLEALEAARRLTRSAEPGGSPKTVRSPFLILDDLNKGKLDPSLISPDELRSCLVVLADGRHTCYQLAHLFGVSEQRVKAELRRIRRDLGRDVTRWKLSDVVGYLAGAEAQIYASLMREEQYLAAWSVRSGFVRQLKELGVVGNDLDQGGLKVTIEAMGAGYERAKEVLLPRLDPLLTGEQAPRSPLALDLGERLPGRGGDEPPEVEIATSQSPEGDDPREG